MSPSPLKRVNLNEKNHDCGSSALGIYIHKAGLNARFRYDGLHLAGDVVEAVVGRGGYLDGLLHDHLEILQIVKKGG